MQKRENNTVPLKGIRAVLICIMKQINIVINHHYFGRKSGSEIGFL